MGNQTTNEIKIIRFVNGATISNQPDEFGGYRNLELSAMEIRLGDRINMRGLPEIDMRDSYVNFSGAIVTGLGDSGTFETADGKTVTVEDGLITEIA